MIIKKEKAFTLIEILVVVMMIGILMLATTVYLGWTDEKRKVIESQWCINRIWWEISNFIFYTLTSKSLKIWEEPISPDYYIIEFAWWEGTYCSKENMCNKINLSYSKWDTPDPINTYKTLDSSNTCHQNNQLRFYRDWTETNYIIMNKWFSPKKINDGNVFYLNGESDTLTWDVIIELCLDNECESTKQIWKFVADGRSQTISIRNCKFYKDNDLNTCKTREGCKVYNSDDPAQCDEY